MENYSQAIQFFSDKKYDESKKLFLESLRIEKLSEEQISNCISKIRILNDKDNNERLEFDIARDLFLKGNLATSQKIFKSVEYKNINFKNEYIFLFISLYESLGELSFLNKELFLIIEDLLDNKRLNIINKLIEEIKDKKYLSKHHLLLKFISSQLAGNSTEYLKRIVENEQSTKLQRIVKANTRLSGKDILLLDAFATSEINPMGLTNGMVKTLLNFSYKELALNGVNSKIVRALFNYSVANKRKGLASNCADNLDEISDEDYLHIARFDDDEELTRVDMANDLFDSSSEFNIAKKLERDIEFLKNQGQDISAQLEELKKIKPESKLLTNEDYLDSGSRFLSAKNTISCVENELLLEISKHINSQESHDEIDSLSKAYKSYIHLMDFNELKENYSDLIIVFNQLGVPEVSEKICEKIEKIIPKDDRAKLLDFLYLKSEVLRLNDKTFLAMNEVDKVLETYPLKDDEKICFLYLKAELYRDLGNKTESLKYYTIVKKLNRNYRLVKQRLKEIG